MNISHASFIAILLILASGCASLQNNALPLHQSEAYYNYLQPSFEEYVDISRLWLSQNRRFITQNTEKEIAMNAPFMLSPSIETGKGDKKKAILLAHGLGDSPFSFSDIAKSLKEQGFHVHVLLLPGHGSKPDDLMLPQYQDWQQLVDHYADLLKQDFDEVWLGGFSTGANLVTINAIEQGDIDGLLLFSPGFKTHSPFVEKLAPIAATFMDWGWRAEEDNLAKYRSSPINASIAYTDSAIKVRKLLRNSTLNIPSFIVMSEADSVIDPYAIKDYFEDNFVHPQSQFIWYGNTPVQTENIKVYSMDLPDLKISTGSHMSPLFSGQNSYYGEDGEKRMCGNGFSPLDAKRCEDGEDVWFSAWGYSEKNKLHARLTWNPYFQEMESEIGKFIELASK